MLGNPKFDEGDCVQFDIAYDGKKYTIQGRVWIVDAYGTFEQNKEPSYDIYSEHNPISNEPILFKHICETGVELIWKNPCGELKKV